MQFSSTPLDLNDALTKDTYIKLVIRWNQGSPQPGCPFITVLAYYFILIRTIIYLSIMFQKSLFAGFQHWFEHNCIPTISSKMLNG